MWLALIGIVIAAIALYLIGFYNGLVKARVMVEEAWADIDTFLKQRFDMIPNLVETVKGYMTHEQATLEKVTALRAQVAQASSMQDKAQADNMLSSTLRSLFAVAESYPELKANQNFMQLHESLQQIEDNLQKSRRYYNGTVKEFNTSLQVFPASMLAPMFGFAKKDFFEVMGEERENVKVDFSNAPAAPVANQPTTPVASETVPVTEAVKVEESKETAK